MKRIKNNIIFLVIFIILSIGIIRLNQIVEPYQMSFKYINKSNDMFYVNRDLVYTFLNQQKNIKYHTVIIGGSSCNDALKIGAAQNVALLNLPGISVLEDRDLLAYFLELHPETKNVIVALEPHAYFHCVNKYTLPKKPTSEFEDFIKLYFSFDATQKSLKQLINNIKQYSLCIDYKEIFNKNNDEQTRSAERIRYKNFIKDNSEETNVGLVELQEGGKYENIIEVPYSDADVPREVKKRMKNSNILVKEYVAVDKDTGINKRIKMIYENSNELPKYVIEKREDIKKEPVDNKEIHQHSNNSNNSNNVTQKNNPNVQNMQTKHQKSRMPVYFKRTKPNENEYEKKNPDGSPVNTRTVFYSRFDIRYYYSKTCEYDSVNGLKKIKELIDKHKLNAIYFIPPAHSLYLAHLKQQGYYDDLLNMKRELSKVISFYDFSFTNKYTSLPLDYLWTDVIHINGFIISQKILDILTHKKSDTDFCVYITKDNVDKILQEQSIALENYIKNNQELINLYINNEIDSLSDKVIGKKVYVKDLPKEIQELRY